MATADTFPRTPPADPGTRTAFLVVATRSVPDERLLAAVAPAGEATGTDGVPVSFHVPVAACVLRVGADFALLSLKCLDAPHFRPREIVNQFWFGVSHYKAKLVTFNGRAVDLPLMELAAFRYGFAALDHWQNSRNRFNGPIDLVDWLTNFGAYRLAGGLDLLAKLLGKRGGTGGDRVDELHRDGRVREINDAGLCAALDTYFVFLRTRVVAGDLGPDQEAEQVAKARALLEAKAAEFPALRRYLDQWTEFSST